ncbi:hypothetical protein F5B19DRAFT_502241 [Rostrohypoxylon terebratum]|nr:hypothetical protein F5B19DRAFT_502241 [Rostrohypoxylon terebratum]
MIETETGNHSDLWDNLSMDYPLTKEEAFRHIAKIRQEKGLDGSNVNTTDLESALVLLSEQLYQKSTHFLLELLQNADDNQYNETTPSLKVHYEEHHIVIICNERGFSKKNVEAICRVGRSTKAGANKATGYIGEKGIGFKSVFKVADVVSIISGHYSFKFDKRERLGMIAPIWVDLPNSTPGCCSRTSKDTIISLQLSPECGEEEIIQDMKLFDMSLLVFLRQLRRVELSIAAGVGPDWTNTIARQDHSNIRELRSITLRSRNSEMQYVVSNYQAKALPRDTRRPGNNESQILLGFSVSREGIPLPSSQKLYAFLPIRDYGFKFLIQADFLLVANREDIDSSCEWNRSLLREIPEAMLQAVLRFDYEPMCYGWPLYLQPRPVLDDFFSELDQAILHHISQHPILRSGSGRWSIPSDLYWGPSKFFDRNGVPLLLYEEVTDKFLSTHYHEDALSVLKLLGVREQTTEEFLDDLTLFIHNYPVEFRHRPREWHIDLSKALVDIVTNSIMAHHHAAISKLELIPTNDGRWVSANSSNLIFSKTDSQLQVPQGLDVVEVHPDAARDPIRRRLLVHLGARELDKRQISEIILKTHSSLSFSPEELPVPVLISHCHFLHNSGCFDPHRRQLWFVDQAGACARGNQLYIESSARFASETWPPEFRRSVRFIHRDYISRIPSEFQLREIFVEWLRKMYKVNTYPLLVSPAPGDSFTLSDDFKLFMDHVQPNVILELIKCQWHGYSEWIEKPTKDRGEGWKSSWTKLVTQLGSMEVNCLDGSCCPLKDTILPVGGSAQDDSLREMILDVPDPADSDWLRLRHLGVGVTIGYRAFIQQLRLLRRNMDMDPDVSSRYRQLQLYSVTDGEAIRLLFSKEPLIFVPSLHDEQPGSWLTTENCVWDGIPGLQKISCLKNHYPLLGDFFQEVLRLKEADVGSLIKEALLITPFDSSAYIADLFIAISSSIKARINDTVLQLLEQLAAAKVFPVFLTSTSENFESLESADDKALWFIADRSHLRQSFSGRIKLLAFTTKQIARMEDLLDHLGLDCRLLSTIAVGSAEADGESTLHQRYTELMRSKAPFIASLQTEQGEMNKHMLYAMLQSVTVYQAEKITVWWSIKSTDSTKITGRADSGRVKISQENGETRIYMNQEDIDSLYPPIELQEEMLRFCAIEDDSVQPLLQQILFQPDTTQFTSMLERRGYRVDWSDNDALRAAHEKLTKVAKPFPLPADLSNLMDESLTKIIDSEDPPNEEKFDSEAFTSFIGAIKSAGTVHKVMEQEWSTSRNKPMFSRVCKLDDQDAALFLPIEDTTDILKKKVGLPDDVVPWIFDSFPEVQDWFAERHTGSEVGIQAVYLHSIDKESKILISGTPIDQVSSEVAFLAELTFSRLLDFHLGEAYSPEQHWTSVLRTRAGHTPYRRDSKYVSTFTIDDVTGAFANFLIHSGYRDAYKWKCNPTFHIELVATESAVEDVDLFMSGPHVEMAQEFYSESDTSSPRDVAIWVIISSVHRDPQVSLFVNPWRLIVEAQLKIKNMAYYQMEFMEMPSHITINPNPSMANAAVLRTKKRRSLFKRSDKSKIEASHFSNMFYRYESLKGFRDIRLLEILSGTSDDTLEGHIRHVSLDEVGQYTAISYQWGSELKPHHIKTERGLIPITRSLYTALKRLRDPKSPIVIWADAVCIDQENHHEKSIQLHLMKDIFQTAKSVCAWLGEEANGSHQAIETLVQIRTLALEPSTWPKELPKVPESWRGRKCPDDEHWIWKDIDAFFQRGWFSRAWIIQEVIFASKLFVYCGSWCLDWTTIFEALNICLEQSSRFVKKMNTTARYNLPVEAYSLGAIYKMYGHQASSELRYGLLKLLEIFSYTNATRQRDKLFSLLQLASDAKDLELYPDYSSSLEIVVRRYAATFVKRGETLDLLYRAGSSKSYEFSSWIPCWTRNDHPRTISTWYSGKGAFCAAGNTTVEASLLPSDNRVLVVAGVYVDKIRSVLDVSIEDHDAIEYVNHVRKAISALGSYPTGEHLQALKMRIPIGNACRPHLDHISDALSTYHLIRSEIAESEGTESLAWSDKADEFDFSGEMIAVQSIQHLVDFLKRPKKVRDELWKYWHTAMSLSKRLSIARFCVTRRGYAGLMPLDAKVGDSIVLIRGAVVPFVIRQDQENGFNKLIGEAYVHGLMHGEGLGLNHIKDTCLAMTPNLAMSSVRASRLVVLPSGIGGELEVIAQQLPSTSY